MPRLKQRPLPTHTGTVKCVYAEEEMVFLRETKTLWVEFDGDRRWHKKHTGQCRKIGSRGLGSQIIDIATITRAGQLKYLEVLCDDAMSKVTWAETTVTLHRDKIEEHKTKLADSEQLVQERTEEVEQLRREIEELRETARE